TRRSRTWTATRTTATGRSSRTARRAGTARSRTGSSCSTRGSTRPTAPAASTATVTDRLARIQLVHWKEEEGRARARELRAAGLRVEYEVDAAAALRATKDDPPDAIVIDLSRLPSHGREVAWALRQTKRTRNLPLVFVGGEPARVARIRGELPDAVYTD